MPEKKSLEKRVGVTKANAKNAISATNASAKPKMKGKPRGKPFATGNSVGKTFVRGDDPRRHTGSRYNKDLETVRKEFSQIFIVKVSEETVDENGERVSKMDKIVAKTILLAIEGEQWASQEIYNRVCGKAPQIIDLKTNDTIFDINITPAQRADRIMSILESAAAARDADANVHGGKGR